MPTDESAVRLYSPPTYVDFGLVVPATLGMSDRSGPAIDTNSS